MDSYSSELKTFITEHVSQKRLTSFEGLKKKCKELWGKLDQSVDVAQAVAVEDFNPVYINTNSFRYIKEVFRLILEYQQEWPNLNFSRECCECCNCKSSLSL